MCRKTGHGHGQNMQIRVFWLICIFSSFKTSIPAKNQFCMIWFVIYLNFHTFCPHSRVQMQKKAAIATNEWLSAEWSVTFWNMCWRIITFCHILKNLLKIHNILSQTARNLLGTALTMPLISSVRWSDYRSYNNYVYKTMPLMCTVIWSDSDHITIQAWCHLPLGTRLAVYGRQIQECEVWNALSKYCGSMLQYLF